MIVCMPTVNDAGLAARLSPHFGSAPFFTLVRLPSRAVTVVDNQHAVHAHGMCRPTAALEGLGVNVVVCRGLGSRALEKLRLAGISVLVTDAWRVEEAVEAIQAGRTRPMTPAEACMEGHRHDAAE